MKPPLNYNILFILFNSFESNVCPLCKICKLPHSRLTTLVSESSFTKDGITNGGL